MRKLSKRERNLLIVFFAILISVVGVEYLLFPSLEKANRLENEKAELELKWEELQFYIGAEDSLNNQIAELSNEIKLLNTNLPSAKSSHIYWEYINESAEKSGVNIMQIQEASPDYTSQIKTIHINLTGNSAETTSFIESLNSMPYAYAVTNSTIQISDQEIATTLTMNISAHGNTISEQTNENNQMEETESSRNLSE